MDLFSKKIILTTDELQEIIGAENKINPPGESEGKCNCSACMPEEYNGFSLGMMWSGA